MNPVWFFLNGVPQIPVINVGTSLAGDGSASAPSYSFANFPTDGLYHGTAAEDQLVLTGGTGKEAVAFNLGAAGTSPRGVRLASDAQLSWFDTTTLTGATANDLFLLREAAGHAFNRNGTNAQRASWANTYTSATNYEAFSVDWQTTANQVLVGTRTAATGTGRTLRLVAQRSTATDEYASMFFAPTSATPIFVGYYNAAGTAQSSASYTTFLTLGDFTSTATSGTIVNTAIKPTYNQSSGTAANTDLLVNRTQTAVGSGAQLLADFQVGSASKLNISNTGVVTVGGAAGAATTASRLIKKVTGIADNTATDVITVTVPNANHGAGIKLSFLSSNGSTDAFESSRVAEGFVVLARTSGVATVAAVAALDLAQIATVGSGATHTLAYGVSSIVGLASATQTFTIQVTINDTGNTGGNQVVVVAEVINSEATGVTIA